MPFWFGRKNPQPGPQAPTCTIDFELGDDVQSVAQFLKRTVPFLVDKNSLPPHFDLSTVQYLGPSAAALLLASKMQLQHEGREGSVALPGTNAKVAASTHFLGLDHRLLGSPAPDTQHPENVTVPLSVVNQATISAADPVIELVHRHAAISEDDEMYLRASVNEVIQNVEDHAQSSFGAVYCARFIGKKRSIRVAIVDCGLGIGTTLNRKHPEIKTANDALQRVVLGGISAKSRPNNMGVGISNLWGHITKPLRGEIFIVTEDVIGYNDKNGTLRTQSLGVRFSGTGVFFTVPVADKGGV